MIKKGLFLCIALLLLSCGSEKTASIGVGPTTGASVAEQSDAPRPKLKALLDEAAKGSYRDSELLVRFRSGATESDKSAVNSMTGASVIKDYRLVTGLQHVKLPAGLSVQEAVTRYMSSPDVLYAEPNYLYKTDAVIPNDTYFAPQQWSFNNTGAFAGGTEDSDIDAVEAWELDKGGSDVIVAVIDTGVDYTHPDLVGNLWTNPNEDPNNGIDDDNNGFVDDWRGWNFIFMDENSNGLCDRYPEDPGLDEGCNDPYDGVGHGTHVAGTIGAMSNNGFGVAGLMWNVSIMPLKVCDSDGCAIDAIEDAIEYAVLEGARVINLSLGGYVFSNALQNVLSEANQAGVLVVASAGNDTINNDITLHFPSGFVLPNMIGVAATNQLDMRSDFSNFGPQTTHVAAPGDYILSTVPLTGIDISFRSLCTDSFVAGYDFCSGTSMAAPHVSGLAGLLFSHYRNFNYSQVRSTIFRYVDQLPSLNGWVQTGGRINAFKALSSLEPPTGLSASTSQSAFEITLTWTDNATGEDGYKIERKTVVGEYSQLVLLAPDATSFTDSGLDPSTEYSYRVRPFNNIGESFDNGQNETSAATPASLTAQRSGGGGGGCAMASVKDETSMLDLAVMILPLFIFGFLRFFRKRDKKTPGSPI